MAPRVDLPLLKKVELIKDYDRQFSQRDLATKSMLTDIYLDSKTSMQRYETDLGRIFYGIPFAQPPIGRLRWNRPVPISKWAPSTINATEIPPACPQPACDVHDILCPKTITLFGQSAGAQSTALHFLTSDMQSFFQAAIIESSPMSVPFRTYAEYITPTVLLAEKLNCTIGDLACFRTASCQDIVAAQTAVNSMLTSLKLLLFFEPWLPVIDNMIVHGQLLDMVSNVSFTLKPLIIGTVTEEALGFIYDIWSTPVPPMLYAEIGLAIFGTKFLKIIERYPPEGSGDQRLLLARLATQWIFACPTRVFARKTATYSYAFGYPLQTNGTMNSSGCDGHTCHGDELVFLFESFWVNFTDADRRISQTLATYWTNYAKSKDPNQPVQVSLRWPKFIRGFEQYLYFQDPLQIQEDYLKDDCDFWDTIGYKKS
ncbi:unnamed protein product [Rotaria sp. Silwood2]|nr:unnamed protein product [Rotaria sp. Silwood2]